MTDTTSLPAGTLSGFVSGTGIESNAPCHNTGGGTYGRSAPCRLEATPPRIVFSRSRPVATADRWPSTASGKKE